MSEVCTVLHRTRSKLHRSPEKISYDDYNLACPLTPTQSKFFVISSPIAKPNMASSSSSLTLCDPQSTIARIVSSRKRATFSTCSRYLITKLPSTDGKQKQLMMVHVQSVRLGVGIECQHRRKALLFMPGPNPVQGALSWRCLRGVRTS
jgi:hypothetical protein